MADRGEMDADLVGAAGLQPAGREARDRLAVGAEVAFEHLPMGDRLAAALAHRHLVARARVAVDRLVDGAARPVRHAPDEGQIAALAAARCGRGRRTGRRAPGGRGRSWRPPSGRWCPCRAGARCRAASPRRCPDRLAPQWAISALTSVPVQLPAAGMDHQAGRLVDDDEVVVLVDDVERDVLRPAARRLCGGRQGRA